MEPATRLGPQAVDDPEQIPRGIRGWTADFGATEGSGQVRVHRARVQRQQHGIGLAAAHSMDAVLISMFSAAFEAR